MLNKFNNFTHAYVKSIEDVLSGGMRVESVGDKSSITSGKASRELLGYNFSVSNILTRIIDIPERKVHIASSIGFFLWILRGSSKLSEIEYYNPIASKLSDDGKTHRGAYGTRLGLYVDDNVLWTGRRNQVEDVIERLTQDRNSRRAFLSVYDPYLDSVPDPTKDYPCTIGYHLIIRNGYLDMTCMMRSQSVVMVMPYDIFNNTMLQEYIAKRLCVSPGIYRHLASSYHILDTDFEMNLANSIVEKFEWNGNNDILRKEMPFMDLEGDVAKEAWEWVIEKEKLIRETAEQGSYTIVGELEKKRYGKYMKDIISLLQLHALKKVQPNDSYNINLLTNDLPEAYKINLKTDT